MKNMKTKIAITLIAAIFATFSYVSPAAAAEQTSQKSDAWIEAQLFTTYLLNEHLNPFDLEITVEQGVVTLAGTVESSAEKDLAIEIAKGVKGVKQVESKKVVVDPEATIGKKVDRAQSNFLDMVENANLTAKVKTRLLWNSNTSGLKINVDSNKGVVTLKGEVDSAVQKELAGQLAANTEGVMDVQNNLSVSKEKEEKSKRTTSGGLDMSKWKQGTLDVWITTKVKTQLVFGKEAEGSDISVSTKNGIVTLAGTVGSKSQKEAVKELVQATKYVKGVKMDLQVVQPK